MKISNPIPYSILLLLVLSICGIFLYSKTIQKMEGVLKQSIDKWVEESLSAKLSVKLGIPYEDVLKALSNSDLTKLSKELRELLVRVNIVFTQISPSSIKTTIRAELSDATFFKVTNNTPWDDLPTDIRSDFLRTGSKQVSLTWSPPALENSEASNKSTTKV